MSTPDLRQLHADTLRALSENRRKHDDLRTRILEMLAEALKITRRDSGLSIHDVADMAGESSKTVLMVERGDMPPPQPLFETYVGIVNRRVMLPPHRRPANEPRVHLLTTAQNPRWRAGSGGQLRFQHGPACGSKAGGAFGTVRETTCEQCISTPIYTAMLEALKTP